jgi:hypothetical protein
MYKGSGLPTNLPAARSKTKLCGISLSLNLYLKQHNNGEHTNFQYSGRMLIWQVIRQEYTPVPLPGPLIKELTAIAAEEIFSIDIVVISRPRVEYPLDQARRVHVPAVAFDVYETALPLLSSFFIPLLTFPRSVIRPHILNWPTREPPASG